MLFAWGSWGLGLVHLEFLEAEGHSRVQDFGGTSGLNGFGVGCLEVWGV